MLNVLSAPAKRGYPRDKGGDRRELRMNAVTKSRRHSNDLRVAVNDEVCSYSFIQNGLRNVTRENSKSNSNVVLNGTCHEFDSCKV